jgi:hypothetical protein
LPFTRRCNPWKTNPYPNHASGVCRQHILDKNHPSTMHLADRRIWTDEWYSYTEPLTDNQKVLITVDESTYDPDRTWGDENRHTDMGDFHPIAWYQEYDGGRSFYTTLGHMSELYMDPLFLDHIYGGIYWAATGLGLNQGHKSDSRIGKLVCSLYSSRIYQLYKVRDIHRIELSIQWNLL